MVDLKSIITKGEVIYLTFGLCSTESFEHFTEERAEHVKSKRRWTVTCFLIMSMTFYL